MSRRNRSYAMVSGLAAVTLAAWAPSLALGQTIDGAKGVGEYVTTLATQVNPTGFGNLQSQLDGLYVNVRADGSLQMLVAGNLEGNYNGLMIWLDNGRPGASSLGNQPDRSIGSITGERSYSWGTRDGAGNGSIFAAGFDPARLLFLRGNNDDTGRGPTNTYYTNFSDVSRPSNEFAESDVYLGSNSWLTRNAANDGYSGTVAPATAAYNYGHFGVDYTGTIQHAFDSSNALDFTAGSPTLNATGFETLLSTGAYGLKPGEQAKIMAIVANGTGDYNNIFLSNQSLPALPNGTPNLGGPAGQGDRVFNSDINGITFLTIPTPTNAAGTTWFNDADWSTGFSPNGTNTQASFSTDTTAREVGINGNPTVGTLYLAGTGGVTFNDSNSGGADITVRTLFGDTGVIRVADGDHTLNTTLKLNSPVSVEVPTGTSVTVSQVRAIDTAGEVGANVSGGGTLQITGNYVAGPLSTSTTGGGAPDGRIVFGETSTVISRKADIGAIRAGILAYSLNGGTAGIGATSIPANQAIAAFPNNDGSGNAYYSSYNNFPTTADDVIVRVTYVGDLDVDGLITAADIAQAIEGYSNGLIGWENGDTNLDGVIDYENDLSAILANYALGLPQLPGGPTGGATSGGAIPEPSALGLLLAAAPLISRRRR